MKEKSLQRSSSQLARKAQEAKSLACCSQREARNLLEYKYARSLSCLPLGISRCNQETILSVAAPESASQELSLKLKFVTDQNIKIVKYNKDILDKAILIAYRTDDLWISNELQPLKDLNLNEISFEEENSLVDQSLVPRALRSVIEYSIARRASDIHFLPTQEGIILKIRVNGDLLSNQEVICSKLVAKQLISRIKVLSSMRLDLHNLPQDGLFSIDIAGEQRQLRVSTMPTIHGEKCVLRVTSNFSELSLETTGFSIKSLALIKHILDSGSGLILLSGATGSGKSTTLYAMTKYLLAKNLSICSIEDPVESQLDGISQTCISPEKGFDYPDALKAILRQDPDVILVGEIRDKESARLVLSAALTGHLVLSTVHGSNLVESITRLLEMEVDLATLDKVLKIVINQSLLAKLCERCKVVDLSQSQLYGLKIFREVGCSYCDYSGYEGRVIAAESMFFSRKEVLRQFLELEDKDRVKLEGYESKQPYIEKYIKAGIITPNS